MSPGTACLSCFLTIVVGKLLEMSEDAHSLMAAMAESRVTKQPRCYGQGSLNGTRGDKTPVGSSQELLMHCTVDTGSIFGDLVSIRNPFGHVSLF